MHISAKGVWISLHQQTDSNEVQIGETFEFTLKYSLKWDHFRAIKVISVLVQ